MAERAPDPYQTLGVTSGVSDEQLRSMYRRLVQLHHPDHNRGSAESARRFEEIQEAYARISQLRKTTTRRGGAGAPPSDQAPRPPADPAVEERLAALERELRDAHATRERARSAAREAAGKTSRPSDEELGYVTTDDSFSKILADARAELSDKFAEAGEHPVARRVGDLIDDLAATLTGERPRSRG